MRPARRYTRVAAVLHWGIAGALVGNTVFGFLCAEFDLPVEDVVMNLHKVIGLIVLGLSLFRLAWRWTHRPPPLDHAGAAQRIAAGMVHAALYLLMVALPVTGWLVTSSFPKRHPISLGPVDLPFLPVSPSMPRAILAHGAHEALALALVLLVTGHVAAALYHQRVLNDGLLDRMRP